MNGPIPRAAAHERAKAAPRPPPEEQAFGMRAYLTDTPGIGGRLRSEPEDFRVIETGPGPPFVADGAHVAARVELRNWETNRFAMQAAKALGIHRDHVAFAGMKDKRAVTEQWFTFKCPAGRIPELARLSDVRLLESYPTRKAHFAGAHEGNRFVLRVRDATVPPGAGSVPDIVAQAAAQLRREGGVPNYFGPQRFGGRFRPVTHRIGKALVEGELEEAVRIFVGEPMATEQESARAARQMYEDTRDPAQALAAYPFGLDPERSVLARLAKRPGDWRHALQALPPNLLQLFVHAHQSLLFNEILSARVEAGLGLATAHVGDRAMTVDEDGTRTVAVTDSNQRKVQSELDKGRAVLTAPLVGLTAPLADGRPGDIEAAVLDAHGIDPADFRVSELPEVASEGRRRAILQPVRDLAITWQDGDPVFAFQLGKGSYATVVLREFMKADVGDY